MQTIKRQEPKLSDVQNIINSPYKSDNLVYQYIPKQYWLDISELKNLPYNQDNAKQDIILGIVPARKNQKCKNSPHNKLPIYNKLKNLAHYLSVIYQDLDIQRHLDNELKAKSLKQNNLNGLNNIFPMCIINKEAPMTYHKDSPCLKNTWAALVTFSKNITGGELFIPDYNAAFYSETPNVLFFSGQNHFHGVRNFTKQSNDAYRYSILFYTNINCLKD